MAHATNYDESKVGTYTLPDALKLNDGRPVVDADIWMNQRRPEIVKLFEENQFGRSPGRPSGMSFNVWQNDAKALDGKAIRKQLTIHFSNKLDAPSIDVLMYLPADAPKPVPMFLCFSFSPQFRVVDDPKVKLRDYWNPKTKMLEPPKEDSRGESSQWQLEKTLARGYGIAWIYYGDIEPDFAGGLKYGVRSLYLKPGQDDVAPDEWGAISAWAWGASRVLDYFETDKDVDARRVVILGHSRLGKTALWTGASDQRFAMVIASCSGEGGAALSRRDYGETVRDLTTKFPYQFCANYQKYADDVSTMPMDSHMEIALVAPRPIFLNTGSEDKWSDPKGEFLAAVEAGKVYELLGKKGLETTQMPPLDHPILHDIGYQCHTGKHAILPGDWGPFLDFADMHLKK